jgi:membrane protease YdiL (CAAX protease family)
MNPIDPTTNPVDLEQIPNPHPPIPRVPFFDYTDFFLFAGLCIPCLLLAMLLVRAVKMFAPMATPIQLLLVQTGWYFLVFGCLAVLFRMRYDKPFWQSLGWRPISFSTAVGVILAGPMLVIAIGLLGTALHMPEIEPPFEQMLSSRGTIVFLGMLVVVLGPIAEELAFRGFLMPLLIRTIGAVGGILVTGVIFGSIHGYEYEWSWQYMLLISLVGCVFGWTKYKTGSTLASALMHGTFNLTQFAALLWRSRTL